MGHGDIIPLDMAASPSFLLLLSSVALLTSPYTAAAAALTRTGEAPPTTKQHIPRTGAPTSSLPRSERAAFAKSIERVSQAGM